MLTRLVFLLSVAISIPAVAADPQLPPDGSWSRYYVQHINYGGDESNYELVLKWLGSITVDGEKCRWIEIDYPENKSVPIPHTGATKLAIPEKQILSGKKLISDQTPGIHYYQQGGDPEIGTIAEKRKAGTVFIHDMMFGTYLQFLPGPRQSAKLTESQVKVPYATGELISKQAYSGTREGDFIDSVNIRNHWENTYKIQTHEEIPFGFVSAEFEWETSFPDEADTNNLEVSEHWVRKEIWTLQDFGVGAKSSIPNRE